MKINKEVRIGIIVLSAILLSYWGLNYLKGQDIFTSQKAIYAVYDRVDGLLPSNVVQVNGYKIGFVRTISLMPDHSGRLIISMHIKSELKIPRNSRADIFSMDFLGTKAVQLIFGDSKEDIQDGDTLTSSVQTSLTDAVGAEVAPIKEKAENLLASLDSVAAVFREVFNQETKLNLKKSFESISKALNSIDNIATTVDTMLGKKNGRIKLLLENLESITGNIKNHNQQIGEVIDNFSGISDTLRRANLSQTILNLKNTLDKTSSIFDKVNKGEGTLGLLVNDDSLYINLNNTAHSLDALVKDLNANPKKYVHFSMFGGGKK
ncbi:MAG: MlaD family protein [Bacteroidetes bacterium]|nr:MlaD family protein [Bacteroidota bacterium]